MAKELKKILEDLAGTDTAIIEEVLNINQDISSMNQDIAEINQDLTDMYQDITEVIDQDIAEINQGISDINQDISEINSTIDTLAPAEILDKAVSDLGTVSDLQTTNKSNVVVAINELVNIVSDISFDTFSFVDKDTKGCTTKGSLADDLLASKQKSYKVTSTSSAINLYTGTFSDVKFGRYALCMRIRVSANTSTSTILNAKILNGSNNILTKAITGTNFTSNSQYCSLCTTFTYEGSSSVAKQPLKFVLDTGTVSGINIFFDYAYITLLTPAIYI